MYVCLCTGVTDREIREKLHEGAASVVDVMRCTGAGTGCGTCVETIASMIEEQVGARPAAVSARGEPRSRPCPGGDLVVLRLAPSLSGA